MLMLVVTGRCWWGTIGKVQHDGEILVGRLKQKLIQPFDYS